MKISEPNVGYVFMNWNAREFLKTVQATEMALDHPQDLDDRMLPLQALPTLTLRHENKQLEYNKKFPQSVNYLNARRC